MKYKIEKIENAKNWNDFVKKQESVNILSSWEWIEFEKEMGYDTQAYCIGDEGIFAFRVVNAKKGKYMILKQNTFIDWENEDLVFDLIAFLKLKCKENGCKFFRISPPLLKSSEYEKLFSNYGFKKSVLSPADGQLTTILDLEKSEEELQREMRKNTRYLIRKAEKLGVEIFHTDKDEYLNDFKEIYKKTVKRHKWDASEFDYIKKQYSLFSSKGFSRMFVAKYEGKILCVSIFTKFQNQVIYHHSGSVLTEIPVVYALIWQAIRYYKSLGLKEFNFFGVCEKDDVKHPWYGLSLFKRGFGGDERRLLESYDYPISRSYYLIRAIETLQSIRR
jgi:lipid II:glycine glycyltransferase (peptidoglycan interpeptide bridge formation enzyme)